MIRRAIEHAILYLVTFVVFTFLLVSFVVLSHQHQQVLSNLESSSLRIAIPNNGNTPNKGFVATLRKKKILVEVTTVGQFQYSLMEDLLDEVRDLCEAGATVSLHITTANCDPNPKPGDPECPLYERSHDSSTQENNYSVEKIDQLNERLRCRDTDGSLDASVHLVSPDWGKQVVDHHRRIFYDHIDEGFDLFVHTEEDVLIRPTSMLAFLQEMENLREQVGPRRLPDYSIDTRIKPPEPTGAESFGNLTGRTKSKSSTTPESKVVTFRPRGGITTRECSWLPQSSYWPGRTDLPTANLINPLASTVTTANESLEP